MFIITGRTHVGGQEDENPWRVSRKLRMSGTLAESGGSYRCCVGPIAKSNGHNEWLTGNLRYYCNVLNEKKYYVLTLSNTRPVGNWNSNCRFIYIKCIKNIPYYKHTRPVRKLGYYVMLVTPLFTFVNA